MIFLIGKRNIVSFLITVQKRPYVNSSTNSNANASTNSSAEENKVHTLKILGPDPGNQYIKFSEREEYKVWDLLQDLLKENGLELDLEAVPKDQYDVVIQTRMASTSLPDIANLTPIDEIGRAHV